MSDLADENTEPLYTLSVAAKLSKTPIHSIRQYIDQSLILPFKTKTNRHLFSEIDIYRLVWIKKQLKEKGLNFAGIKSLFSMIPCWKIRPCSMDVRQKCEAYNTSGFPCWESSEKGSECKNMDCRLCNVYQISGSNMDIKSIFRKMIV